MITFVFIWTLIVAFAQCAPQSTEPDPIPAYEFTFQ